MSALEDWQKGNDKYLAAALMWLRLRLMRLAGPLHAAVSPQPSHTQTADPTGPSTAKRSWFGRTSTAPFSRPLALPAPSDTITEEQVAEAAAAMAEAEAIEPPPALVMLTRQFGLSRFEKEVLLLCSAMELDTRLAALCARVQDDPNRPYPTFAVALAAFDEPAWEAVSPGRPLRYWRLIEINQPGAQPLTTSALRADERIVNFMKGLNALDDRLSPLVTAMDMSKVPLPTSQQAIVESVMRHIQQASVNRELPVIEVTGIGGANKQLIVSRVGAELGLQLYRLPMEHVPSSAVEMETFARLWQRETFLLPVALYIDAQETERTQMSEAAMVRVAPLNRLLTRSHGLVFLGVHEPLPELREQASVFDVTAPTPAEQRTAWAEALGSAAGDRPPLLAGQFNLDRVTMERIVRTALNEPTTEGRELRDRLWQLCRAHTRPRLDALAQRLEAKATWDDLVLPADAAALLRQIADQVRHRTQVYDDWRFRDKMNRGLGISALFAGESGTGKTMATEVIANDLQLDLYRIDLSAVVSKYIGETEKNLRRLFDTAEDCGAILLFDEADALFGKRSEVKDSHDRYANIEINYLLQRMEGYRGLAILATNMKSALDTAFMRRLRFVINFPFPGVAERKAIWQNVWPPEVPIKGLDHDRLARFNLTGGSIHNIALNAAFLAARANAPVTMPLVLEAMRVEFRKLERPINEIDFRWLESAGGVA